MREWARPVLKVLYLLAEYAKGVRICTMHADCCRVRTERGVTEFIEQAASVSISQ